MKITITSLILLLLLPFPILQVSLHAQSSSSPKPKWLQDGIVMAGNWEPLIFRTRRGHYLREGYVERYKNEHTEETIRRLAAEGVNYIQTHFYKGFGLQAEKEDIEYTKKLAALCRKYGIRVGLYIGGVMAYETLFQEVPEAREWIRRDENGKPLYYWDDQTFRYKPNFFRADFQEYMKGIVREAIEQIQPDALFLDNLNLDADPLSDHSPYTAALFRKFLREKYSPDQLKCRLGFSNLSEVKVPEFKLAQDLIDLRIVRSPMFQEWFDFRCERLTDYVRMLSEYARQLDPDIVVSVNVGGITDDNRLARGVDLSRILPHTDFFLGEESDVAQWTPNGALVSMIRSYKVAELYNNLMLTYTSGFLIDPRRTAPTHLYIAEALAFGGQTTGMVCWMEEDGAYIRPESRTYIDFFLRNKELYKHTRGVADVAVLRSFPSMAYNNDTPLFSTTLFEQTLIQKRVPFDIIFDANLRDLSKYKVLVLADQESVGEKQLDLIRQFVNNGGGLVAVGSATIYNERRIRRLDFGLSDVLNAHFYYNGEKPSSSVKNTYGKGRAIYIPEIVPAVSPPQKGFNGYVPGKYWKLPANAAELYKALRWVSRDGVSLEVAAPDYVAAELRKRDGGNGYVLHLLNYKLGAQCEDLLVKALLPENEGGFDVTLRSPELPKKVRLEAEMRDGRVVFRVPVLKTYDVIVIDPRT